MNNSFGFIGTGNMGGALARAAAKALVPSDIVLSDRDTAKAAALAAELGCRLGTIESAAAECGYVFLGVKPQVMPDLLNFIAPVLASRRDSFVLVTMAAGIPIADIRRMAGGNYPVIRIMPNMPVAAESGVVLYDASENVPEETVDGLVYGLSHAGLVDRLPEALIDAGCALTGCGPAFVCLVAEALADGAVACGLPRDKANKYAAQTLLGTAKYLLEGSMHPGQLKDAVCSPGGSTIAGVRALEDGAVRADFMKAVAAAFERTVELGK